MVEDMTGDGGYFRRWDVLELPVTSAPQNDRWRPGQIEGLCQAVIYIVSDLLEQSLLDRCASCLVQGVADGFCNSMPPACAYVKFVYAVCDDRTLTGDDVDDSLDEDPWQCAVDVGNMMRLPGAVRSEDGKAAAGAGRLMCDFRRG
jgi:hypothetical protein